MKNSNDVPQTDLYYPVIIIGAGISGIASACQLKRKFGCNQFMVFESQDGIGVNFKFLPLHMVTN